MNDLSALRRELDKLVETPIISRHEFLMTQVGETIPHTIRKIPDEPKTRYNYNCFAYAVGLADSELHTRIAIASADEEGDGDRFYAHFKFADHLVREGILVEVAAPVEECIATYWMEPEGLPTHMGVVVSATDPIRMKSKWGIGNFWEHGLLEFPQSYGDHVRYFESISTERAEKAFIAFCRTDPGFEAFCERHDLGDVLE